MIYSVLDQPVIPVQTKEGMFEQLGIRATFARAHELKEICADNPMESYALLRLLIAFAMDMLHPENSFVRADLLDNGQFDMEVFEKYIALCERIEPRFDLFDLRHPFMQAAYDEGRDAKAEKPVSALFQELPSGNNHVFFDHRFEDSHTAVPARAFRAMCAAYVFATSGTQGPSSVNNAPPLYVIAEGQNLYETIVFNMLSVAECGNITYGLGAVPWRRNDMIVPKESFVSVTMLEALTWQPRRVTLLADEDGYVRKVCLQAGKNFIGNNLWMDPHVPYKQKKDMTYATIKAESGRELWRDFGALLTISNNGALRQPSAVEYLPNILDKDIALINVRVVGLVSNNAKLVALNEERMSVPVCLLENEYLAELVRADIGTVEALQLKIYDSVNKNISHETAELARGVFLQQMNGLLFGAALARIVDMENRNVQWEDERAHVEWFDEMVRQIIKGLIVTVIRKSGDASDAIFRQMETEKAIWLAFKKCRMERS